MSTYTSAMQKYGSKPVVKELRKLKYAAMTEEKKQRRLDVQRAWRLRNKDRERSYYENKRSKIYLQREMLRKQEEVSYACQDPAAFRKT
jgi:hypothetical protein